MNYAFQFGEVWAGHLTVLENCMLALMTVRGTPKAAPEALERKQLAQVQVPGFLNRRTSIPCNYRAGSNSAWLSRALCM